MNWEKRFDISVISLILVSALACFIKGIACDEIYGFYLTGVILMGIPPIIFSICTYNRLGIRGKTNPDIAALIPPKYLKFSRVQKYIINCNFPELLDLPVTWYDAKYIKYRYKLATKRWLPKFKAYGGRPDGREVAKPENSHGSTKS